jgi:large subunit ribosomal protein L10
MALTRSKKEEIIKDLTGIFSNTETVVFINFHGLNVVDTTAMRRKLREKGISYRVAKKTLVKRVLGRMGYSGELPGLVGELALVYTLAGSISEDKEDPVAPAREIYAFQKQHKEALSILGGIFQGAYADKETMAEIATIPPMQVLYGQFVSLLNLPLQKFAVTLDQIAKSREK